MDALVVLLTIAVPFALIGYVAKRLVDRWMARKGVTLDDLQPEAGPDRRKRRFLLGFWRKDD
jgi:hypothetical protein